MFSFKKDIYKIRRGCPNCIAHDVTIDTQIWTGCNLNVETYRNGDHIPEVTDPTIWASLTTGAWCHYNNDPVNGATYGKLYNWHAVNDPRGLAPVGYHIPSDTEWTTLTDFLGGLVIAGGAMKEEGLCHWNSPNTGAVNTSLFTGLPGGVRNAGINGNFLSIGEVGGWWSSTVASTGFAWYYNTIDSSGAVNRNTNDMRRGWTVRLIKD